MIDDQLFSTYIRNSNQSFSGWDFSLISGTGRMQEQLLSWSYGSIVILYIQKAKSLLDMGTGGGEFLSKLQPFPQFTYATEAYKPNISIARERLEPLGVKVVEIENDENLPFDNASFELIINKHESYSPKEVRRLLSNNGTFITQQVGGKDCFEINEKLGVPLNEEYISWNLHSALNDLTASYFNIIDCKEEFPILRFYDIGALIYYLNAIPWQVPGFQTDRYLDQLYEIHKIIQATGYFDVTQHRFIIKAEKN